VNEFLVGILTLAGVVVTAAGSWIIAKHRLSGKVDTTDAAVLWQEGKDLRDFLVSRIEAQSAEIAALKIEVRECKHEVANLRQELKERWPANGQ
jgi:hypothetical protein